MTVRRGLTEEEVEAAIKGDRAAIELLTVRYLPRVYGLCLRVCRRQDLAEEATQEAFVRALRALPRLRNPERLTSWLLAIAANTTRELAKAGSRTTSLDATPWEPASIDPEIDDAEDCRQKALDLALSTLEPEERELFLLHTVEGVRLKALAAERDCSVPAIKSRVHRIRSKIRVEALHHLEAAGVGGSA